MSVAEIRASSGECGLGGGVALNVPGLSAVLLLASSFAWFALGSKFGYGINIITIGPLMLNAIGGLLALAAAAQGNSAGSPSVAEPVTPEPVWQPNTRAEPQQQRYDNVKWQALLDFDPEIARIEATLRPFGQKYVDQFAAGYLVLNDKAYIPNIIKKVTETAEQDAAERGAAEARWENRFSDPTHLLWLASENITFLGTASFGSIAILKNGQTLVERNGTISKFPDATSLRAAARDQSQWMPVDDPTVKLQLVKLFSAHVPGMAG